MAEKYISLAEFLGKSEDTADELFREFKVPADIEVEEEVYDAAQCASVLLVNLPPKIQRKLNLGDLEELLEVQTEYMDDFAGEEVLDEGNMVYLAKWCAEENIDLTKEELAVLFDLELGYLYMLGLVIEE